MARYDKYNGMTGGFRAPVDVAWGSGDVGVPTGVGLNANGRIVKGAGNTGVKGVLVIDEAKAAGEVVDTMTSGEIVECGLTNGTTYYANDTTGALETSAPATGVNKTEIGSTLDLGERLVARVQKVQG